MAGPRGSKAVTKLPLDYTRCRGINCSIRETCLRFTDWPPRERLSMMVAGDWQDGVCLSFIGEKDDQE